MRKSIHRDIEDIPSVSIEENGGNVYDNELRLAHERVDVRAAVKNALKKERQQRAQIIHNNGKHTHVVTVSSKQADCYNTVKRYFEIYPESQNMSWSSLRALYLESTINALGRRGLLKITNNGNKIALGTYVESDTEIMEKGGVGNITINMIT